MPRYFFDVVAETLPKDDEGSELPDLDAARAFALGLAMVVGVGCESGDGDAARVSIRNEQGAVLEMIASPEET